MASDDSGDGKLIHILFVGAGAVGCFYASRLHHPSNSIHVSLVCRSNYSAVAKSGVMLETRDFGTYKFAPHAVYPSIDAAASDQSTLAPPSGYWDFVVVSTKALPDVTDDSAVIAPLVRRDGGTGKTCIVLLQNGVGIEVAHRARFPRNPITSAVTVISAVQLRPSLVRQNRWTRISVGAYTDGVGSCSSALSPLPTLPSPASASSPSGNLHDLLVRGDACARRLVQYLTALGCVKDAEHCTELALQQLRWHKLAINAAMNPSAILSGGRGNADMALDPDLRAHLKAIMQEIWAAAPKILGQPFPASLASPDRILESTERNTTGKPSMLLDWESGRPLETEVILGLPIRIARERGVDMPRLQTLYALVKSQVYMRDRRLGVKDGNDESARDEEKL